MLNFPDIIPFNWNDPENIDKCYNIYLETLYSADLHFLGKKVHYDNKLLDGKHACFWHLITRDEKDFATRYPNRERLERIHWPAFILQNSNSESITCWEELIKTKRGLRKQTFLWAREYKFIVILELQNDKVYRMVTSYYIDQKWAKERFKKSSRKHKDPRKNIGSAT
jgi:hypothetical protein